MDNDAEAPNATAANAVDAADAADAVDAVTTNANKRPLPTESSSGNPANIQLENVRFLWLKVTDEESGGGPEDVKDVVNDAGGDGVDANADGSRYLVLEDTDTGDLLLPLYVLSS